jgi:hypothetical protein
MRCCVALRTVLLTVLVGAAPLLGACGGMSGGDGGWAANAERAFLEAMVPHHESASGVALTEPPGTA